MKAAKRRAAPQPVEQPPPRPRPPSEAERDILRNLDEAADWIDGARDQIDELAFTCSDATSSRPLLTRASLRRSGYEDAIEGMRMLRFALRGIQAARDTLRERLVR